MGDTLTTWHTDTANMVKDAKMSVDQKIQDISNTANNLVSSVNTLVSTLSSISPDMAVNLPEFEDVNEEDLDKVFTDLKIAIDKLGNNDYNTIINAFINSLSVVKPSSNMGSGVFSSTAAISTHLGNTVPTNVIKTYGSSDDFSSNFSSNFSSGFSLSNIDTTIPIPKIGSFPIPPTIVYPKKPTLDIEDFESTINIEIPKFPTYEFSEVELPTFTDITIPNLPQLSNISSPNISSLQNIPDPSISASYSDENYIDNINRLKTAIDTFLGGGVDTEFTAIEKGFIERGYAELDEQYKADIFEEQSRAERLGYTIPSGVILHRLELERTKYLKNLTTLQNETNKSLAELANRNRGLAINGGASLEQAYMNLFIQKMTRKLEYYKTEINKALTIYSNNIQRYSSYIEKQKADILIYSEKLKGELSKIEIYKAQIEGQKLISDINNNYLEKYKGQLQAKQIEAQIYESNINAISEQIKGELSKVEIYKAEVEAYKAKLAANEILSNIYKNGVEAEGLKIQAYETQVKAFVASVQSQEIITNAYKARADIAIEKEKLELSDKEVKVKEYAAKAEHYDAQTRNFVELHKAIATLYEHLFTPLKEMIKLIEVKLDTELKHKLAVYDTTLKAQLADAELRSKYYEVDIAKIKGMIDSTATLAGAYANALNYSFSFDGKAAVNYSGQDVESFSINA